MFIIGVKFATFKLKLYKFINSRTAGDILASEKN